MVQVIYCNGLQKLICLYLNPTPLISFLVTRMLFKTLNLLRVKQNEIIRMSCKMIGLLKNTPPNSPLNVPIRLLMMMDLIDLCVVSWTEWDNDNRVQRYSPPRCPFSGAASSRGGPVPPAGCSVASPPYSRRVDSARTWPRLCRQRERENHVQRVTHICTVIHVGFFS